MKNIRINLVLFLNINLSYLFCQSFLYNYVRFDRSISKYSVLRLSWCFEEFSSDHNYLESTEWSVASIFNKNHYYFSLNPIPSTIGLLIKNKVKPISDILMFPQRIGNLKIQLPFSWETAFYFGLNTDYYYNNRFIIYNDFTFGLKHEIRKIKISVNYNLPIIKGFLDKKASYFSLGIGYVLKKEHGG
jgi:hypothetical protein